MKLEDLHKTIPDLHKKTERMVQAGIWMVIQCVTMLMSTASWLQREIRRFDYHVKSNEIHVFSIDAINLIPFKYKIK